MDGRPIANVRIQVIDTERSALSDDSGHYTLGEREPGTGSGFVPPRRGTRRPRLLTVHLRGLYTASPSV